MYAVLFCLHPVTDSKYQSPCSKDCGLPAFILKRANHVNPPKVTVLFVLYHYLSKLFKDLSIQYLAFFFTYKEEINHIFYFLKASGFFSGEHAPILKTVFPSSYIFIENITTELCYFKSLKVTSIVLQTLNFPPYVAWYLFKVFVLLVHTKSLSL